MMDFSFLNKALVSSATRHGKQLVRCWLNKQKRRRKYHLKNCATNIYYTTDLPLLWGNFRTLVYLLQHIQQELPQLALRHRFYLQKVKELYLFIRTLIERVSWNVELYCEVLSKLQ